MLIKTETPAWIAEGDCPFCSAHSKAVIPPNSGAQPGMEVEMRCVNCKKLYSVILPPRPSPTITLNPQFPEQKDKDE